MGEAARMVEDLGYDAVDINLGCPAKKVVKCGGSGLLRDMPLLEQIFRAVRAAVKIPADFLELSAPKTVAPAEVEDAFIKANPGLSTSAVAVTCDQRRLSEVRICMSKDLQFHSCEEIDRRACRRDSVVMPPVRN